MKYYFQIHESFSKWAIPGLFLIYFRLFNTALNTVDKTCRRLDSNCGSLVSEATALTTAPQPLPIDIIISKGCFNTK